MTNSKYLPEASNFISARHQSYDTDFLNIKTEKGSGHACNRKTDRTLHDLSFTFEILGKQQQIQQKLNVNRSTC